MFLIIFLLSKSLYSMIAWRRASLSLKSASKEIVSKSSDSISPTYSSLSERIVNPSGIALTETKRASENPLLITESVTFPWPPMTASSLVTVNDSSGSAETVIPIEPW